MIPLLIEFQSRRAVNRGVNVSQQPAVVEGAKPVVEENKQEVKAEKAVEEIKNDTLPPITSSKPSIEPKALQGKTKLRLISRSKL